MAEAAEDMGGGLDNFDEDAAVENLANVGADVPAEEEAAPTAEPAAPVASEPPAVAAEPGTFPAAPTFEPLGPPPPAPELSPDPAENTRRMVEWQRQLADHHSKVTDRQVALNEYTAKVATAKGAQEARLASQKAEAIKQETQRAADRRAAAQSAIDQAVQERIEAKRNLESFKWEAPHDGKTIAAIILGAVGAGLQNAGAAQLGQVGHAENAAMTAINAKMQKDYDAKKAKYQAAGDALLMAKYGVKTAEDAHRAAMNDLNADFAARYKLVADQAEAALKQSGVPAEQAKGNALVVQAREKQAQQEAQIHQREEGHRDQREQAAATLALAKANLGERRAEFALRREDAAAARAEKKDKHDVELSDKKEARLLRDENTGEPLKYLPTAKDVARVGDQLSKTDMYVDAVEALAQHIQAHGRIYDPFSTEYKERESLIANVQAMGRGIKGIQASDAGQKLEHQVIGGSGLLANRMADPTVLRKLADEAREGIKRKLTAIGEPVEGKGGKAGGGDMVTITNKKTGEKKRVTREEAQKLGAL